MRPCNELMIRSSRVLTFGWEPWAKVGDGMKGQGGELSEIKVLPP
jgi:hypothetical protein